VIDDDHVVVRLLVARLGEEGHTVESALTSEEGLRAGSVHVAAFGREWRPRARPTGGPQQLREKVLLASPRDLRINPVHRILERVTHGYEADPLRLVVRQQVVKRQRDQRADVEQKDLLDRPTHE